MKNTILLFALTVFLTVSGVTLAQQSGEEKKHSSTPDMMQQMMKQKQSGEGGEGSMGGMMGMRKMMQQCASMMDSVQAKGGKTEREQRN